MEKGYNTWLSIKCISDEEINQFLKEGSRSKRNLKCLRCIALFICELDLLQEEAALLIHSGIASIEALAILSPQELLKKINRLQISLRTDREHKVDFQ